MKANTRKNYDVIVIGSGGGMKIALPASQMGLKVAFIEEGRFGGTCLTRGCIPSKMLIYPTEFAERIRESAALNIQIQDLPRIDFTALVNRVSDSVDEISSSIKKNIEEVNNIDIYPVHGRFISDKVILAGNTEITADRIFIATGSEPSVPAIAGLEETPFMTSVEALRRRDLPNRLIVIGAGYIAVELGSAYRSAGAEVEFIVRSRLLRREDSEVAYEFERVFSRSHSIHKGVLPEAVSYEGERFRVTCKKNDKSVYNVEADALLVATGISPRTGDLGLENTGIVTTKGGYIKVDPSLRTSVEGVYALGDVVGNYFFRHTVNHEGEYLMRTAFSENVPFQIDYGPVPHAVFTTPEVAGVGMTEKQVKEKGIDYVVGRAEYKQSNQGLARGLNHGLCKILVERSSQKIIGAHIVGEEASDMIHLFIVLMKKHGILEDLLDMIFIHPALPEIARDAARDAKSKLSV